MSITAGDKAFWRAEKLNQHKEDLDDLLADNGKKRLAQLKKDGQADIDKGYVEIEKTEKSLAEASNRKQEIDRQHYTIPNQRPKDKHCDWSIYWARNL